jgi:hypothetical protein
VRNRVECRSNSEYAERPVAIYWEGRRLEVYEVLARWRTPQGKRFRVNTTDELVFEVWYNEAEDSWEVFEL